MASIQALRDMESLASYMPEGVWSALMPLVRSLPDDVKNADNLALYSAVGLSTTKDEVNDTAGARPLFIVVQSTGTLCYLHLHNADADNVTAGVNVDFLVPVGGTSGEVSVVYCAGKSWKTFWNTGLTASVSTATETSSAPTNTPNVWILLATS